MAPAKRDHKLTVMLSEDEMEALKALAAEAGFTASQIIRVLVRTAHAKKFGN